MRRILAMVAVGGMMAAALAGCSQHHRDTTSTKFVQGKATVVDVNNALGLTTLRIDGQDVPAYWETQYTAPAPGTITYGKGPFGAAVGDYKELNTQTVTFPAKAGDTIMFRGMRTGNEILLRAVQVISK